MAPELSRQRLRHEAADGRGDGMSIYASLVDITMRSTEDTVVRTTINLPEPALELAKKKAAEEDASLGEVIAEAIYSTYLARPAAQGEAGVGIGIDLPVSKLGGGLRPGVRLENNAELEDVMNGLP